MRIANIFLAATTLALSSCSGIGGKAECSSIQIVTRHQEGLPRWLLDRVRFVLDTVLHRLAGVERGNECLLEIAWSKVMIDRSKALYHNDPRLEWGFEYLKSRYAAAVSIVIIKKRNIIYSDVVRLVDGGPFDLQVSRISYILLHDGYLKYEMNPFSGKNRLEVMKRICPLQTPRRFSEFISAIPEKIVISSREDYYLRMNSFFHSANNVREMGSWHITEGRDVSYDIDSGKREIDRIIFSDPEFDNKSLRQFKLELVAVPSNIYSVVDTEMNSYSPINLNRLDVSEYNIALTQDTGIVDLFRPEGGSITIVFSRYYEGGERSWRDQYIDVSVGGTDPLRFSTGPNDCGFFWRSQL